MGISFSIAHSQFHFVHVFYRFFKWTILLHKVEYLILRHGEIGIYFAIVRNCDQRFGDTTVHQRPYTIRNHAGYSVHRAFYFSIRKVIARIHFLCFSLCQCCFCRRLFIAGCLQIEFGHNLFFVKFSFAIRCQFSSGKLGFRAFYISHCCFQRCFIRNLVDNEKCLPFMNGISFIDTYPGNYTTHLRTNFNILPPS